MKHNLMSRGLAVALAISMTGCGQGFKGSTGSFASKAGSLGEGGSTVIDTKAIEDAATDAQLAIDQAHETLLTVVDEDGKVHLFSKSSNEVESAFLLDGIKKKLTKKLDLVVNKVKLVKAKFNEARQKIADAIAKIDTSNSANAALVAALNAQMEKIDVLEEKFYEGIQFLTGKLDFAMTALDKLILLATTSAGSINPILGGLAGVAAAYLIGQVKSIIADFKAKLLSI